MKLDLGSARIVTVRELARDTASVLKEINDTGEPAVVSRHGKLIAVLAPLGGAKLELRALELMTSALPDVDEASEDDNVQEIETQSLGEILREREGGGAD